MVRTSSITVASLVGLGFSTPLSDFFCLSVTLSNDKVCERHFAINELEPRNNLDVLIRGRFVVVYSRSIMSLQRWAEPPQNDEFENTVKYAFFRISRAT